MQRQKIRDLAEMRPGDLLISGVNNQILMIVQRVTTTDVVFWHNQLLPLTYLQAAMNADLLTIERGV